MSTVVIVPNHFAISGGNLNGGFAVGRALRARGHEVKFLSVLDFEGAITTQGFGFQAYLPELYPKGRLVDEGRRQARGDQVPFKERLENDRKIHEALATGAIERGLGATQPDLLVVSGASPEIAIGAAALNVPTALYSTCLPSPYDPIVPPLIYPYVPDGTLGFRAKTLYRWRRLLLEKWIVKPIWNEEKVFKTLAKRRGFPTDQLDFRTESFWPRLGIPELVLWPSVFDLPRSRPMPNAHFVEPGVDPTRTEQPFAWEKIDASKPLAFCAPGTMACYMHKEKAQAFLYAFFDALRAHPEWQGIAAVSSFGTIDPTRAPANCVVVEDAPQVDVLKRTSVFVTHGGANSVKEAVYFGVPMVAVPLFFDHFGYSARIVYHGVGERITPLATLDGARLGDAMARVLADDVMRARVRALSAKFVAVQAEAPSVAVLEGLTCRK